MACALIAASILAALILCALELRALGHLAAPFFLDALGAKDAPNE